MAIRAVEFLNPRFVKIVDIHVRCCEVCQHLTGNKETVYHMSGGGGGPLYCVKGHKLSGKNNDLHLMSSSSSLSREEGRERQEERQRQRQEEEQKQQEQKPTSTTTSSSPSTTAATSTTTTTTAATNPNLPSQILKRHFVKMLRMGLTTKDIIQHNKKIMRDAVANGFISQEDAEKTLIVDEKIVRAAAVEAQQQQEQREKTNTAATTR